METQLAPVSTDALAERVEHMILSRTNGTVRDLKVIALDGELVLTGNSCTYYGKQLASQAALDACGTVTVTNDIAVA